MLAIADILQTVEDELKKFWPEDVVYQNAQPIDFVCPYFLVKVDKSKIAMLNADSLDITLNISVSGFVLVDEQPQTYEQLVERMAKVLNLFCDGYFAVKDRHPHVTKLKSRYQTDFFTVKVQLNWTEKRINGESLPLMGELKLNMQEG